MDDTTFKVQHGLELLSQRLQMGQRKDDEVCLDELSRSLFASIHRLSSPTQVLSLASDADELVGYFGAKRRYTCVS